VARGSQNLLLVEDDEGVRDFIVSALTSLGYEVKAVSSAEEAMQLLNTANVKIDLVLTDVVMPGISGQELAEQIKKYFAKLPVIFISGYTDDHIAEHGVLGLDIHFVQKPFSIMELSEKIQQVIKTKK